MKKIFALLVMLTSTVGMAQRIQLYFPSDGAAISSEHQQTLQKLVDSIPCDDYRVAIVGHTDGDGSDEYNEDLSNRRTSAIASILSNLGVDRDRMDLRWNGESTPVAANDSELSKAKNRRVVVEFTNCPVKDTSEVIDDYSVVMDQIRKESVKYTIGVERDTIIVTPEGSAVFIPAYAFKSRGRVITRGTVEVTVNDVRGGGDMIRMGVSTVDTGGNYLQTGGMIQIEAKRGSTPLELDKNLVVGLSIPGSMKDAPVWSGTSSADGNHVVWQPMPTPGYNYPAWCMPNCIGMDCRVIYVGNCNFWCHLRNLVTQFRWNPRPDIIESSGEPLSKEALVECNSVLDSMIKYGVSNIDELMDTLYYKDITKYGVANYQELQDTLYRIKLNEARDRVLSGKATNDDINFVFPINQFGWFNCDRYLGYPKDELASLKIVHRSMNKIYEGVHVVLPSENAVFPGMDLFYWEGNSMEFKRLPRGVEIRILAIRSLDGQLQLARENIENFQGATVHLSFQDVNLEELNRELDYLNEVLSTSFQ